MWSGLVSVFLETPTECYAMIDDAYRDQVMSCRQVFHRHIQFREDHTSSVAMEQSGKPVSISTDVMINTIGTLIMDDNSLTQ